MVLFIDADDWRAEVVPPDVADKLGVLESRPLRLDIGSAIVQSKLLEPCSGSIKAEEARVRNASPFGALAIGK